MSVSETSLVSDVVTYNAKVWLAGIAATLFVSLSLVALALDVISRRTGDPNALARRVLEASARFEAAIDIHGDLTDVRMTEASRS